MQGFQPRGGRPDLLFFRADGALLQGLAPTSQPSARGRNPGRGGAASLRRVGLKRQVVSVFRFAVTALLSGGSQRVDLGCKAGYRAD